MSRGCGEGWRQRGCERWRFGDNEYSMVRYMFVQRRQFHSVGLSEMCQVHGNSSIALRVSSQLIGCFEDKSKRPFLRTSFALGLAGFSTRVSTIWLGPMTSDIQESLGRAGSGSVTRLRLSECNTCMLWV